MSNVDFSFHLVLRLRISGAVPPSFIYTIMACVGTSLLIRTSDWVRGWKTGVSCFDSLLEQESLQFKSNISRCTHNKMALKALGYKVDWIYLAQDRESRNRPGVALRVPGGLGSQIFMTFGTWKWWVRQPHAPATFTPRNVPGTHFH
jgi:hypothetical protein